MSVELLSPFAPLFPWLESSFSGSHVWVDRVTVNDVLSIDLRPLAVRVAVLAVLLRDYGHARPWALGEGFGSDLTPEQAGRVVAEMVRGVGADPAKPVGVIPVAVLGARYRERGMSHEHRVSVAGEAFIAAVFGGREDIHPAWMIRRASTHVPLAEMARQPGWMPWDAQESCDAACVERGMLLWEQVTPPCL